ncbi:MAG: tripartite tricarboxylate transporter permease [Pseudomonadota bacterium]|nr:tripartite tricarboxylate transporter permease [Pseudomonadota bacterium]
MLEALLGGLSLVFQWPAIGYLVLGVFLGIWLGAVPGLGGIIGLVILLPFTYGMDPVSAFALLLGMFAVTSTSDTIASVMLGIPGTAASQATILDGYPMAQQGKAARAFGAAFTVSAFGGVFGALILAVSIPLVLPIILAFGSPELLMLGVLGIAMVGSLSGGSILKGLIIALLGLMMSMIGYAETAPIPRYWFGTSYLLDGLPLIPVVLGLFALPELMDLAIRDSSIARVPRKQSQGGGMVEGIKDAFRHWWLALRCAALGTYVGMLPGLGAAVVDWFAYGHAVQSAKDKSRFGKGDIRGVIAPEAANNATRGGALLPMVAFGIPGSLGTAILMGALLIQGLKPGPEMLTDKLDITFSMIWTIVVANILVAGLLMLWSNQVAKIAFVRGHLIVPGVIMFVFMGAWLGGASMGDWIACLIMGVIGFIMKRGGWPRPPLVLALILGPILENAYHISMRVHDGLGWTTRPIVLVIIGLIFLTLFFSFRGFNKSKNSTDAPVTGDSADKNLVLSLPFAALMAILFSWAAIEAVSWPAMVRQFPLTAAIPAAVLSISILLIEARGLLNVVGASGGWRLAVAEGAERALVARAGVFFGYLVGVIVVGYLFGQMVALTLFIFLYLMRWGGYGWRMSLGYAAAGWLFLYAFYDKVMNVFWHKPLIFGF